MQQRSLSEMQQPDSRKIYTVYELTAGIKLLLESTFPYVTVEGEISNFTQPSSGHFYFSLKDDRAQIRAVMWKSSHRFMKWRPKNGMKVMVTGKLTLYEPSGQYQLEAMQIVPHGKGDLFAAFEQLKERLQAEGLFDAKRKRPVPLLPKKIGIVTSRTGAAIQDILKILDRRYVNLHIRIFPAKVQGEDAAPTIVEGIRALNRFRDIEVLIVGRGGGSMEDLWPFNEEIVARAIVASRIPVISAVGHETDTTIADFVADVRAPTPSAAAEMVIGKKSEYAETVSRLYKGLHQGLQTYLSRVKNRVTLLSQHRALAGVPQRIRMHQQTTDEMEIRLKQGLKKFYQNKMVSLLLAKQKLNLPQLQHVVEIKRSKVNSCLSKLVRTFHSRINENQKAFSRLAGNLDSLSPLAVLERGYSITANEQGIILKDSSQTMPGERLIVRLHRGRLKCEVQETENE
jgi:exodeoxyribonuclease VII large subunit